MKFSLLARKKKRIYNNDYMFYMTFIVDNTILNVLYDMIHCGQHHIECSI